MAMGTLDDVGAMPHSSDQAFPTLNRGWEVSKEHLARFSSLCQLQLSRQCLTVELGNALI